VGRCRCRQQPKKYCCWTYPPGARVLGVQPSMATGDASGDHGHRDAVAARARREKPSTFEETIGPGCRPATLPRVSPKRQPSKDNRQHHRHDGNIQGEDRHAVRGLSINGFARRLSRGNELKDRAGSLGGRVTLQPCILYFRAAFDWRSKPCDVNVCRTHRMIGRLHQRSLEASWPLWLGGGPSPGGSGERA
jgi:hypothetical protein